MAVCKHCGQEKKTAKGCAPHKYMCDKILHVAILYADEREGYVRTGSRPPATCHDCHVQIGQPHHPGCDIERCPVCSKQLTNCGCSIKPIYATAPSTDAPSVKG